MSGRGGSDLTGTGALTRMALRRDRVLIPVWVAVFALTAALSAAAAIDLYPSRLDRIGAAEAVNGSSALVALYGRIYDPASLGAVGLIKLGGFGAVMVALLSIVIVVRHTRADEESGRLELVGATGVGRRAPIAAALVVAAVTNGALALLTSLGLVVAGLAVDGSIAFGLAWGSVGMAFAAIAAVAAQVTVAKRAAVGLSAAVLAAVYAVRALGDVADASGPRWLTWLSPIGWAQQFRPYAGNRFWVLGVSLTFTVVVVAAAVTLAGRRDLGTGLLPVRPGPAGAPRSLSSAGGLAWRLQRATLLAWSITFALLGTLVGSIASSVGQFLNNPAARDFITTLGGEAGLVDAFLAVELVFAGIFASAYGIQAVMRLRGEEEAGTAEPVLASAVGRTRWVLGHVAVATGGTVLLLVLTGLGAGAVRSAQTGDGGQLGRLVGAALVQLPAVWVLVGITLALFGVLPRLAVGGWVALAAVVVLGELGPLLQVSQWALDLSPFAHTPKVPGGELDAAPLVAMTGLAVALAAVGLVGFRRRDLA